MTTKEKLICLDFIVKLCNASDGFLDLEFGANGNKLYIDSCLEYESEEQKELIKKLLLLERKRSNNKK